MPIFRLTFEIENYNWLTINDHVKVYGVLNNLSMPPVSCERLDNSRGGYAVGFLLEEENQFEATKKAASLMEEFVNQTKSWNNYTVCPKYSLKLEENPDADLLPEIKDEVLIIRAVNSVGVLADAKDWEACRRLFAEEVQMDYTSLAGGEPSLTKADQLISDWKGTLDRVHATQHMITNHQVSVAKGEARCFSNLQAFHFHPGAAGGDNWTVVGTYEHRLIKNNGAWKIAAMKLNLKNQQGNRSLLKEANAGASENRECFQTRAH